MRSALIVKNRTFLGWDITAECQIDDDTAPLLCSRFAVPGGHRWPPILLSWTTCLPCSQCAHQCLEFPFSFSLDADVMLNSALLKAPSFVGPCVWEMVAECLHLATPDCTVLHTPHCWGCVLEFSPWGEPACLRVLPGLKWTEMCLAYFIIIVSIMKMLCFSQGKSWKSLRILKVQSIFMAKTGCNCFRNTAERSIPSPSSQTSFEIR